MNRFSKKYAKNMTSLLIIVCFIGLTVMFLDVRQIWTTVKLLIQKPYWLVVMLFLYFISFCLKALAWNRYLRGRVSFFSCLVGILYSLFINHLLPIKVGDLVRVEILHNREKLIKRDEAFHSVVVLRAMDMCCLIGITIIGLLALDVTYKVPLWLLFGGVLVTILVFFISRRNAANFLNRQLTFMKNALVGINGFIIFTATLLSWLAEAGVLYGTVHILKENASLLELAFVNSLTIAGQIFQVTPGGVANYESFMVFGLGLVGISLKSAYIIALVNHGIKFIFSYAVGVFCLVVHPLQVGTIKSYTKLRGVRGK